MNEATQIIVSFVVTQALGTIITVVAIKVELRWIWSEIRRAHRRLDKARIPDCSNDDVSLGV
jgi:hypothetical protein